MPSDVVVAAAGSVDHDELVSLVEGYPARTRDGKFELPGSPPEGAAPRVRFESKDTEQYHVALGAPGIARHDERRFALRVLDNVLGGTSSSRLFQEVRERRGLAYSVYSFSSQYANAGQVGIYLGTRGDNLGAALDIVGSELERLRVEPVTAEELSAARRTSRAGSCSRSSRPPPA